VAFSSSPPVGIAGLTMMLSGFLLFQVQPMMARYILPWFGGSATTWTVCLLFFQVSLLLGYFYAYVFTKPLRPKAQIIIHLVFIVLSLFALPITPTEGLKPPNADAPTLRILALLAVCVGLPYLVLSTTTPLVQNWLASAGSVAPSRLFALSNFGSMLGLITYPVIVDLYLPTDSQTVWWSIAYVAYAGLMVLFGLLLLLKMQPGVISVTTTPSSRSESLAGESTGYFWLWFAASALASASLLATTNYITSYVATNPFLWILPLSLYLLSFVITFARPSFYRPTLFGLLYAGALALNFFNTTDYGIDNAWGVIAINLVCFGLCCMVCQGELAQRQPPPQGLTFFYLTLAAGGAAGGAFVSLIAPVIFPDYWELPIGLIGVGLLHLILHRPNSKSQRIVGWATAATAGAVIASVAFTIYAEFVDVDELIARDRNFYGVLKVEEFDAEKPDHRYALMQAGENQGEQLIDPKRRHILSCDFGPNSGVGLAVDWLQRQQSEGVRIGVIGLGVGMLLTYGRPQDAFRYYELNPSVTDFARNYFHFMEDTKSVAQVVHGDGRLSLEREFKLQGARQFDMLHIDAFRGNAPPAHLMTKEAFEIYFKHLRPGGILAVTSHVDYYDASSLLRGMADQFGAKIVWIPTLETRSCRENIGFALISRDNSLFDSEPLKRRASAWPDGGTNRIVWTDQSSSLMGLLIWTR
jgi:spermidine synthase